MISDYWSVDAMVKTFKILGVIILLGILFACNSRPDIDFRSVFDNETGEIFSLGDDRSVFINILGEGFIPESTTDVIHFGDLAVFFESDIAIEIAIRNESDRFEFRYVSLNISERDLGRYFTNISLINEGSIYLRFFDHEGRTVLEEDASYFASIVIDNEDERVIRLSIAQIE